MNSKFTRRSFIKIAAAGTFYAGSQLAARANPPSRAIKIEPIEPSRGVTEASGVARHGDQLIVVSDAVPGVYYSLDIGTEPGPLINLAPERLVQHEMHGATLAIDFEAVDILADGRIVALSERLRSLIGENGLVMQYDDPLSELGERGLEGLAVRPGRDGASDVAVLWEGGWVDDQKLQAQLRRRLGQPLLPVILTHELARGAEGLKLKVENDRELIELKVPQPDAEKFGWRFRAPDLVWHEWHTGDRKEEGFIVLLNSQTVRDLPGKSRFGPRWLMRFDRSGNPVGSHVDLDDLARELLKDDQLRDANWEGLAWYEVGKRLVLVHDKSKNIKTPVALVIDLPKTWL
jgi:hypothetical protein